jgi:hypothetical protein
LSLQSKRWQIAQPVTRAELDAFSGLPPLVVQLLYNRGITEPAAAADFLAGRFAPDDPFKLAGISAAGGGPRAPPPPPPVLVFFK